MEPVAYQWSMSCVLMKIHFSILFVVQINANVQTTHVHEFAGVGVAVLFAVAHVVSH